MTQFISSALYCKHVKFFFVVCLKMMSWQTPPCVLKWNISYCFEYVNRHIHLPLWWLIYDLIQSNVSNSKALWSVPTVFKVLWATPQTLKIYNHEAASPALAYRPVGWGGPHFWSNIFNVSHRQTHTKLTSRNLGPKPEICQFYNILFPNWT
jgi:hypothetical protein